MDRDALNLHDLANMPGYGVAQRTVRALGLWDETAASDGETLFKFKVKVSGTYLPEIETEVVTVEAKSAEEAKDKAADLSDFDEVEDCEILSVAPAE